MTTPQQRWRDKNKDVKIARDLHTHFDVITTLQGKTMKEVAEQLIAEYVKAHQHLASFDPTAARRQHPIPDNA
jgi:hypothetical protein